MLIFAPFLLLPQKVYTKYLTNPEIFTTINAIIEEETENKTSTNGQVGALWLKR